MTADSPFDTAARSPVFFDETLRMLRDQIRRFVETEIKPRADAWEAEGRTPRALLRRMGELGFLGIRYPEALGGAALDQRASVVWAEELGRSTYSGVAITALVHTDMASVHIFNAGSAAQKAEWIPRCIAGAAISAVAVTEPGAGSDVKGIATRARRDGDAYVLTGSKMFITNGVHADVYCVAAKTDPEARPSQSVTMFLVEKDTPGFTVSRALDKHGWRSSDTAELRFDGARVPAANVLGREGGGFYEIMQNFQNERLVLGAMCMGECQAALELTLAWVRDRKAFGAPLWDRQTIRQRLALLAARVESCRQFVYATAARAAAGEEVVREVSMIKALAGELVNEVM